MGFGDSLLATGHAKPLYDKDKRIYFGNGNYMEYEDDVYVNNPYLGTPEQFDEDRKKDFENCIWIDNYMGHRPYVRQGGTSNVIWNHDYRAPRGDVWLTDQEIEWGKKNYGEGYILVEPHTKNTVSGNKAWIWDRWQEVTSELIAKGEDVLQNGSPKKRLNKSRYVAMLEFRHALIAVANCKMVVTTQGGLHVAAAALNKPAVVLWGEYAHPRNLGYEEHVNLYKGGEFPCGVTVECKGCHQAMKETTVEMVLDGVNSL
jgi:ADP-heptose:LPS heptosyltransferase